MRKCYDLLDLLQKCYEHYVALGIFVGLKNLAFRSVKVQVLFRASLSYVLLNNLLTIEINSVVHRWSTSQKWRLLTWINSEKKEANRNVLIEFE